MDLEEAPTKTNKESQFLPWVEKYRPKKMDDVSHQEEALNALRRSVKEGNLPHLLFYGPPGTGKTSTILALTHELFGPDLSDRVLEMNASDERGIDVIREKVILFARQSVRQSIPGYPSPPYKIIIMDEADSLTMDAQSALRRVMEQYSRVTRFCFICNYISKIIPALSSRCARFEFGALPRGSVLERLSFICGEEKIEIENEALEFIFDHSRGDLRAGIQLLQNAETVNRGKKITVKDLESITLNIPKTVLFRLWDTMEATKKASSIAKLRQVVDAICMDGYPVSALLSVISDRVVEDEKLSDAQKAEIALILANADKATVDGCDEELTLLDVCCSIVKCL